MQHPNSRVRTDLTPQHEAFIEIQNSCPLCGHWLEIHVESLLEDFNLKEEAHCPQCEVPARIRNHKLQ
ncbi:MAG: hypothetical protein KDD22_00230 [Bdellovibrionales bacterium]|nr:hypothetical protein [Bdellovibrionales bacterium]